MAVQAGFCQTWLETPKTGFSHESAHCIVVCETRSLAVGMYVYGGDAPVPSSLLLLPCPGVPASGVCLSALLACLGVTISGVCLSPAVARVFMNCLPPVIDSDKIDEVKT